jgi:tRNA(Arg) A34 adenosine deaminase TadA
MSTDREINRRDLIVKTAGVGAAGMLSEAGAMPAVADASKPPPGFSDQPPLKENWSRPLHDILDVSADIRRDAPALAYPAGRERHRVYCYLLMKLLTRFWNGNKRGPFGRYPDRAAQLDRADTSSNPARYRGDMTADSTGIAWDRYLGHNIACIAVDRNGEIIDFDFNHDIIFRSTAEHAESRIVRRLFSLTDVFDNWKIASDRRGVRLTTRNKPSAGLEPVDPALADVTLYTSLESCAQCSGVMSLAGIKQIVYMQSDFTQYRVGNLMYKLANRPNDIPGAPIPIAGSDIDLDEFKPLNDANLAWSQKMTLARNADDKNNAFFVSPTGEADFDTTITSFLCTDAALKIFQDGGSRLAALKPEYAGWKPPGKTDDNDVLTNGECLAHANEFYAYADAAGYRGSPHKL